MSEFFGQRFTRVALAVALIIFLTMGLYPRERLQGGRGTQSFSDSWIVDLVQNESVNNGLDGKPQKLTYCDRRSYCGWPQRGSLAATGFALMGVVVAVGVAEKMLTEDDLDNDEQAAA